MVVSEESVQEREAQDLCSVGTEREEHAGGLAVGHRTRRAWAG